MRSLPVARRPRLTLRARDYAYALRLLRPDRTYASAAASLRGSREEKPSVVLLPGVHEHWTFMRPVADLLHDHGYDVHAVETLGYNTGSIEEMAELAGAHLVAEGVDRCVLVAHSKGGLVGKRLLLHHPPGVALLGLVAINTPFNGSPLARLVPLPTLRMFRPESRELTELTAAADVNRFIVSIFGSFDPHIPGGSRLEGARNVQLQTRGHFLPLGDPRMHAAILDAVESFAGDPPA
jgi:triacylglycerol lipase